SGARDAAEIDAVRGPRLLEPRSARGRPLLAGDEVRHLRWYHQADQPPSTTRFAPVTYVDPSEARNTTAPTASETSIRRPSGERAANASTNGAGCPLSIPCGVSVLTRTPLRPQYVARERVRLTRADFETEYATGL